MAKATSYLKGQWTRKHLKGYHGSWTAFDPALNQEVTLVLSVHSFYKLNGRIRDPQRTRNVRTLSLRTEAGLTTLVEIRWQGEDFSKTQEKETNFREKLEKLYGIAPY